MKKFIRVFNDPYAYKALVLVSLPFRKHITIPIKYIPRSELKLLARDKLTHLVDVVSRRKIYLYVSSTDCDHCNATYAAALDNISKLDEYLGDLYNSAEGQTYTQRMTLDEYENFEASERDYMLEAFEDGHSHSVRG